MRKPKLNADEDFLVKESVSINIIAGAILLTVFLFSMVAGDSSWKNFFSALSLLILPAGFYFAAAKRNATFIKINTTGFHYAGKLLTTWDNFIDATFSQKMVPGSIQDNFVLLLRYYDEQRTLIYTLTIPMTNTQDKAEEEISAAIEFYYNKSKINPEANEAKSQTTW